MVISPTDFAAQPEEVRATMHAGLIPRLSPYVRPDPARSDGGLLTVKQLGFLKLPHREALYGGAAGGGKSIALLAGALQYCDVPGYSALILRRNFKQLSLPGALMAKSHEWLSRTNAHWSTGASVIDGRLVPPRSWIFPSGATLTFGHLGLERESRRQYESAAFNYIGVDELTQFDEDEYRFLFSRLRRQEGFPIPSRMRSATNPGGRGHAWVKARFVDPKTRLPRAAFLPARLTDNPNLDQGDYVESLQELHPTTWRRLLHGDWDVADAGELFQPRAWLDDDDYLDTPPPPAERVPGAVVRYWDLAAAEPTEENPDPDWTAGARISRLRSGVYCYEHLVRVRRTPHQTERIVRSTSDTDGRRCTQWVEQTPGAGKALVDHYRRNVFPERVIVKGDPVTGQSKAVRARPLAAAMEKHRVRFVRHEHLEALFDEMEAFSEDPSHSGAHDDMVDASAGAFAKVARRPSSGGAGGTLQGAIPR